MQLKFDLKSEYYNDRLRTIIYRGFHIVFYMKGSKLPKYYVFLFVRICIHHVTKMKIVNILFYWSVHCEIALLCEGCEGYTYYKSMVKSVHYEISAAPSGQFLVLRSFNKLKDLLSF